MSRANQREQQIIETAAAIFCQNGFHATTLEEIASALGMRKASLYYYVRTKDDLLMLILKRGMELIIEELQAICGAEVDPVEKLRRAIANHIQAMDERWNLMGIITQEQRAVSSQHRAAYIALRHTYEGLLRSIVSEGIDGGAFRPCDADAATRAILGMCNWLAIWYRRGGRLSPAELAAEFTALVLGGLTNGGLAVAGESLAPVLAASGGEPLDTAR